MKIDFEFNTRQYVFSHGREPRGYGSWAFTCWALGKQIIWAPVGTYCEAKRWIKEQVRSNAPENFVGTVRVEVCP